MHNNSNDEVQVVELEQERDYNFLDSSNEDNNEYISLDKAKEDPEKTAEAAVLAKMDMKTAVFSFKVQLLAAVQSLLPDDDDFHKTNNEGNEEGGARQQQNLNNNATNEESNDDDEMAIEPLDFAKVARDEEKRKREMEPPAAGMRHLPRRGGADGVEEAVPVVAVEEEESLAVQVKPADEVVLGEDEAAVAAAVGEGQTTRTAMKDHCDKCDSNSLAALPEGDYQANYPQADKKYFSTNN